MNLIRTDLAVEAAEPYRDRLPDGVSIAEDERAGVKLTRVEITKPEAAERLGRPCGRYITLELPAVSSSVEPADDVTHAVADELSALLPAEGSVLVVGLGNEQITPDA
ncbi:GPR endopeptidase, partial [Anaerotruncus massiliensis (ex Liu et al. 2021)]